MSANKTALVLIADGAEEMEVVIVVDVLRRGGVEVTLAGIEKDETQAVVCSRKIKILPDTHLDKVKAEKFDAIILPGGLIKYG